MAHKNRPDSPLQRSWNIFSAIAGVIGTAGMVDDIVQWVGLIRTIVEGYSTIIGPILNPVAAALGAPTWFADYLFVGLMLAGARSRPAFNMMRDHWKFEVAEYPWYAVWAPHRVGFLLVNLFMALLWPLALLFFLPLRLKETDSAYHFQSKLWRAQYQWLVIYGLLLVGLFIGNAGLRAIANTSTL